MDTWLLSYVRHSNQRQGSILVVKEDKNATETEHILKYQCKCLIFFFLVGEILQIQMLK